MAVLSDTGLDKAKWLGPFLDSLGQLADLDRQKRAWIAGGPEHFPAPTELICQIFDDSGVQESLDSGTAFSEEADILLRQLGEIVAHLDMSRGPEILIRDPNWLRAVDLARSILAAISTARPNQGSVRE